MLHKRSKEQTKCSNMALRSLWTIIVRLVVGLANLISPSLVLLQGPKLKSFYEQFSSIMGHITILGCPFLSIRNPNNTHHAYKKFQPPSTARYWSTGRWAISLLAKWAILLFFGTIRNKLIAQIRDTQSWSNLPIIFRLRF